MATSRFHGRIVSSITAFFLATQILAAQNTIHVPADHPTIQAGINAANNGDTVLVAPGTYHENINFMGKAITVTSSAIGGPRATFIDGGSAGPVVTLNSGETASAVLQGFTIQNGATIYPVFFGGGIYIVAASPTITNNIIQNNSACSGGAGIFSEAGSPKIQGNLIQQNTQTTNCGGAGGGGGIFIAAGSAQITGNTIINNEMGDGGGIALDGADSATVVSNNLISGNTTASSPASQGGGIQLTGGNDALIVQNLIYNNTAGQGAGVYVNVQFQNHGPVLINNTIAGNSSSGQGSAVYATGYDNQVQFFNNLMVGVAGQNAVFCDAVTQPQPPAFNNNDAFSANATGWDGTCAAQSGQSGNISIDPQFVNPSNADFHLQSSSPVIDAGRNDVFHLPKTDYDGNPRALDGNNDCMNTVDMGAFELVTHAKVSISPLALSFPSTTVGTSSSPQTVTLSNSGNTCWVFSQTQVSSDFSEISNCGGLGIRGGGSCTFSISFIPASSGNKIGTFTVTGSDGITTSNLVTTLNGFTQTPPSALLSPTSLNLGSVAVGSTATASVSLTNTGQASLNISSVTVTSPFSEMGTNCPASLGGGASCFFTIGFRPVAAGPQNGTLTISDNASGSPQTVSLSGMGLTPPAVQLSAASISFGTQLAQTQSPPQTITLTNTGQASLQISAINFASPFSATNTCPTLLAGGASCSISVTYTALVAGTQTGSLTIIDNAAGSPHVVSLSGTGVDFTIAVNPTSVTVKPGSTQFTVHVTPSGGPFNFSVALSCSGQPLFSTCSFSPSSVVPGTNGATSVLTVSTSPKSPHATVNMLVVGSSGGVLQHSAAISVTVK